MTCILYRRHREIQFNDPIVDLTHLRISSSLLLWYGGMECTVGTVHYKEPLKSFDKSRA